MTLTNEQIEASTQAREIITPTRRATSAGMEEQLYLIRTVLDHGFVRVIDYMGDDSAIVQAARVSYGHGTKTVNGDEGLIRYLMRHWHSTPFEMCEVKFHFKMPMFIGEQTLRHRTANVNKESGRYSVLGTDKYVPDLGRIAKQSSSNKQGSGNTFELIQAMELAGKIRFIHDEAQKVYDSFVSEEIDMSRELARGILPANQYAEFYWKIDLHNLFHFLRLRLDRHAQYEIRVYAVEIAKAIQSWVPLAYAAFEDYRMGAVQLSRQGHDVVNRRLSGEVVTQETSGMSPGEWREFSALWTTNDQN